MAIGAHTRGWSVNLATPTSGDAANQIHVYLQNKARDIGERFEVEHELNDSTTTDGQHLLGSARSAVGATATRPPDRTTTSQDGPTTSSSGGNESGRMHYDSTRNNLGISDGTNWIDIIPTGVIAMWSGSAASIPDGWYLCDGTNGTPDLSGRFIVGYDAGDSDYDTVGNTGGSKTHTLTTAELPSHTHVVNGKTATWAGGGLTMSSLDFASGSAYQENTGSTGSGDAHENRPPYYTLAFIYKR